MKITVEFSQSELQLIFTEMNASVQNGARDPEYPIIRDKVRLALVDLRTAPQPPQAERVPMTDEEIDLVRCSTPMPQSTDSMWMTISKDHMRQFARAVLAAQKATSTQTGVMPQ